MPALQDREIFFPRKAKVYHIFNPPNVRKFMIQSVSDGKQPHSKSTILIKTTMNNGSWCWSDDQMRLSHSHSRVFTSSQKSNPIRQSSPIVSITKVAQLSSNGNFSSPPQCWKVSFKRRSSVARQALESRKQLVDYYQHKVHVSL